MAYVSIKEYSQIFKMHPSVIYREIKLKNLEVITINRIRHIEIDSEMIGDLLNVENLDSPSTSSVKPSTVESPTVSNVQPQLNNDALFKMLEIIEKKDDTMKEIIGKKDDVMKEIIEESRKQTNFILNRFETDVDGGEHLTIKKRKNHL